MNTEFLSDLPVLFRLALLSDPVHLWLVLSSSLHVSLFKGSPVPMKLPILNNLDLVATPVLQKKVKPSKRHR